MSPSTCRSFRRGCFWLHAQKPARKQANASTEIVRMNPIVLAALLQRQKSSHGSSLTLLPPREKCKRRGGEVGFVTISEKREKIFLPERNMESHRAPMLLFRRYRPLGHSSSTGACQPIHILTPLRSHSYSQGLWRSFSANEINWFVPGKMGIKGNTGRGRQNRLLKRVGTVLCACLGVILVVEIVGYGRHSAGSRHRRRKG